MPSVEDVLKQANEIVEAPSVKDATLRNAIARLQEIQRTLLPDFPSKSTTTESISLARRQIALLIGDLKAAERA